MGERALGKDSAEFKFFNKFWAFLKLHYNEVDRSQEQWNAILSESREIISEFDELNHIGKCYGGEDFRFPEEIMLITVKFLEAKERAEE